MSPELLSLTSRTGMYAEIAELVRLEFPHEGVEWLAAEVDRELRRRPRKRGGASLFARIAEGLQRPWRRGAPLAFSFV